MVAWFFKSTINSMSENSSGWVINGHKVINKSRSWYVGVLKGVVSVLIIIIILMVVIKSPYIKVSTGPVHAARIEKADFVNSKVTISYPTVQVSSLSWLEYFWENSRGTLLVKGEVTKSPKGLLDMWLSKSIAWSVAGNILMQPNVITEGVIVTKIIPGGWGERNRIQVGDIIVAVGVKPIKSINDYNTYLGSQKDGASEKRKLLIQRFSEYKKVLLPTIGNALNSKTPKNLGIKVALNKNFSIPEVDIPSGNIGGPSGGVVNTLLYLEYRSGSKLLNGKNIVGTGEITSEGAVLPVAGIPEKLKGAEEEKADVFILPAGGEQVASSDTTIKILKINTIEEAIRWLCLNGGKAKICSAYIL